MKKKCLLAMVLLFGLGMSVMVGLYVSQSGGSSADTSKVKASDKAAALRAASIGGGVVGGREASIFPSNWIVPTNSFRSNLNSSAVINIQEYGDLPRGNPTSPGDVRRLEYFSAENLTQTNAVGFWGRVRTGTNETVALVDVSGEFISNDPNHYLNETVTFPVGSTYTKGAMLRQGNTWIDSGPATQAGNEVIVGFGSKHFNNSLADVRAYMDANPGMTITFTLKYKGTPLASYTISSVPGSQITIVNNGTMVVGLSDTRSSNAYTVQYAENLDRNAQGNINWVDVARITGTNTWTLNADPNQPMGFARLVWKP